MMDLIISILRLTSTIVTIVSSEDDVLEKMSTHKAPYMIFGNEVTAKDKMMHCPTSNSMCNIVHNRFWFSPKVIQMCQCPENAECPYEWIDHDKHTMQLNNRAQMKFCGEIGNLNECNENENALITQNQENENKTVQITEVRCFCPKHRYFKIKYNIVNYNSNGKKIMRQVYGCAKLEICNAGDFCGYITTNNYETYHRCRCPHQHICIIKDRVTKMVKEALYRGEAFFGWCMKST